MVQIDEGLVNLMAMIQKPGYDPVCPSDGSISPYDAVNDSYHCPQCNVRWMPKNVAWKNQTTGIVESGKWALSIKVTKENEARVSANKKQPKEIDWFAINKDFSK